MTKKLTVVEALRTWKDSAAAIVAARYDAWVNEVTGFGTARDKTTYGNILPSRFLADEELSALYHGDDMAQRMVDTVPGEMLRKPFSIETGDPGVDAIITDKFDELDVRGNFLQGMRWGRCYGGGAVLIGADDGRDASKPLVPERARDISYLYAFDRRVLWPMSWYTEDGHPKLGQPETYAVTAEAATVSRTSIVHESRLIIFRGAPTGNRERVQLFGWDMSYLQRAYEILRSFNTGWKSVETMLTDGNQPIFKMTGLADLISSNSNAELMKRLQVMNLYRSVMRALVIDADSQESFERNAVSFAEIPGVLEKFMLRLAASAEMPVTILMGQSPAGMNATGESDIRWFYDRIESKQGTELSPQVRRLVKVWLATKAGREFVKTSPKTLAVKFPSLWTETPLAAAQRRFQIAQGDAAYVQANIFLPDEVALTRGRADGFDGEIQLTKESIKAREAALAHDLERLEEGQPDEEALANEAKPPFGGGGAPKGGAPAKDAGAKPRFDVAPRTFHLHRHDDETGVSGTGIVADGCVFEDGTCVVRWRTATASTTVFKSVDDMLKVHGHGGKTELVFLEDEKRLDGDEPDRDEQGRFTGNGGGGGGDKASATMPAGSTVASLDVSKATPAEFKAAFNAAMKDNPKSAFVSHYSEEELSQMTCLTAHDGKVGVAVKDHGDGRIEATALFNNGAPPGSGTAMLAHAVNTQGVNYVECFAGTLDGLYAKAGFQEDSRSSFSKEHAPPNWNYDRDKTPDYITMRLKK